MLEEILEIPFILLRNIRDLHSQDLWNIVRVILLYNGAKFFEIRLSTLDKHQDLVVMPELSLPLVDRVTRSNNVDAWRQSRVDQLHRYLLRFLPATRGDEDNIRSIHHYPFPKYSLPVRPLIVQYILYVKDISGIRSPRKSIVLFMSGIPVLPPGLVHFNAATAFANTHTLSRSHSWRTPTRNAP